MKKSIIMIAALLLVFSMFFPNNETKAAPKDKTLPVLSEQTVEFDLNLSTVQEKEVYDKNGEYVGTMGIEPVENPTDNNDGIIRPMATYPVNNGNSTFKIYWYTAAINLSYYINISQASGPFGYSKITKAYDEWHLVTPPLSVTSDTLSILRAQESAGKPAEARYRLKYGALGAGSITYDLKAKVELGYLYTSVSSFN